MRTAARARRFVVAVTAALAVATLVAGCAAGPPDTLGYREIARYPHDTNAFTQGLLWHDGALYESTGLYGASTLRRVNLEDGTVQAMRYLDDAWFAEGLARVDDTLIQLTWRGGRAFRWPIDDFDRGAEPMATHRYTGEGWGLCYDGDRLVMSDGSARLVFRDPDDFAIVGEVEVTLDGSPLTQLNELECVGGAVWANVWFDDRIVRIDPTSGRVTGIVDASDLLDADQRDDLQEGAVLNGIAWRPDRQTFLLTGKLWPVVIEVEIDDTER